MLPAINGKTARALRETFLGCLMAFSVGCGMMVVKPVEAPVPREEATLVDPGAMPDQLGGMPTELEDSAADAADVEAINAGRFKPWEIGSSSLLN